MKYLYLLAAAVILIAALPTQAKAAPNNPPQRQGVLSHRPGQPGEVALTHGHSNPGRGNRDRYQNPNRNRDDQRGWQRNGDHRRSENRGGFQWTPPWWRWFLRWQAVHGDQENRGHRGH